MKKNLVLIALTLWSGIPSFFTPFVHTDEGGWATLAKGLFTGEIYHDFTDHKPPLLFIVHWLFSFGETSLQILHFSTALWLGLGAMGLYWILQKYLSEKAAFFAAALFAILSGLIEGGAYLPERIYIPLAIFMVVCAMKGLETSSLKKRLLWFFVAGICAGSAACLKQPALLFISIPVYMMIQSRKEFFLPFFAAAIGGLGITFGSWAVLRVPFHIIWQESYLANFTYMQFHQVNAAFQSTEIMKRIVAAFMVLSMPVFIGGLRCLFLRFKNFKNLNKAFPMILLFMVTLIIVSLGRRFYETYFIAALPCFAIMTVLYFNEKFVERMMQLAVIVSVSANTYYFTMQFTDRNKNWDSKIQALVSDIQKDSSPEDRIWINHNLQSVYYAANRKPAVKYIYFQHSIGYADPCTAADEQLVEHPDYENFQTNLKMLNEYKPKIIFWTQRPRNTCADRIKLENFPIFKKFIEDSYTKKWENKLGTYYLRNPS
ncbi:MAG: glycosyltransferase family 39 protein [Deltaproteobacteria bacterium]|nr:glycosyltransferase family 39 protein [Deltaproteobacteria bacterium]